MRRTGARLLAVGVSAGLSAVLALSTVSPAGAARDQRAAAPQELRSEVVPGQPAIRLTWQPSRSSDVTGYAVQQDGRRVATVAADRTTITLTDGLILGGRHSFRVSALTSTGEGREAGVEQTLHVQPVTTVQAANPTNPLARPWGVYLGRTDPAMNAWLRFRSDDQFDHALIPMMHKAKFFGKWIPDHQAYAKTREYIENTQNGDPTRLTIMTMFRMSPWEGDSYITHRLPTVQEKKSYRRYIRQTTRAIGDDPVAVVLQPDGFFAKLAYEAHRKKGASHKEAMTPARMLAWTTKTFMQNPNTTVYIDMGSEDWSRGRVGPTVRFLKRSGIKHARGFSLNVSHKNYLDREIKFGAKVVRQLAKQGIRGKKFVLDTSDNGNPFHGAELNAGKKRKDYTPPGDVGPCRSLDDLKVAGKLCTALGVPPTTDVDHPNWGLDANAARLAAKHVDAYLWISRPWLPHQGAGGTKFNTDYAKALQDSWQYSPYFS